MGDGSGKKPEALIRAYLQRGGFEMQVNIVNGETLLDANAHPKQYQDLVVRIDRYSDYFVRLSEQMQAELIMRTAHEM